MGEPGRPSVMTEEVIVKIEEELKNGATLTQAAFLANISLKTLYNYFNNFPDFKERCNLLQDLVSYRARKNIVGRITEGDIEQSKYWLDRKDKEFKPKSDVTTDDKPMPILGYAIPSNNSNNQDNEVREENTSSSGRNISVQDSINNPILNQPSPERPEENPDLNSIGEHTPPEERSNTGFQEHTPGTPLLEG